MINYYQYQGTISASEGNGQELILHDISDDSKPPIIVKVFCRDLAKYLVDRSWTDEEERYLRQTWIYDENLYLTAVVIPSVDGWPPAKVIACSDPDTVSNEIIIFGPQELIDTAEPERMSNEDAAAWLDFRCEHCLRPVN